MYLALSAESPRARRRALDRCIDALIEIDDRIVCPQFVLDLFAGHNPALMLNEHPQNQKHLLPQKDLIVRGGIVRIGRFTGSQFTSNEVELKKL